MNSIKTVKMSNFRWVICALLFLATTVNYMDRQVLSLTWKDFIAPEFHWTDADYGTITGAFSIFYAIACLFAGKFVDWMGTKKGYLIAIFVWSLGACLHAVCGIVTMYIEGLDSVAALRAVEAGSVAAVSIATVSVYLFLSCRLILAIGEAGNFPAAIKVTAEFFPKKDRAFATSIFNAGASVGALAAPMTIPILAEYMGWEWAFIIIGAIGFIWMFFWAGLYTKPGKSKFVNEAELAYIHQDDNEAATEEKKEEKEEKTIPFLKCFTYKQTWSFIVGKFFTDGVWWFYLFWAPAYFSDQFGYKTSSTMGILLIFTLYAICTFLSIGGGYLPKVFVEKMGMGPYAGRMRAMLIFTIFPLFALFAQPLGENSAWWPAIIIGLAGAGHQAWSANLFSTIGDMFPKSTIATITGIGAMAGGIGSFLINTGSGLLFTYSAGTVVVSGSANVEPQEMTVKAYKQVLKTELKAKGEAEINKLFATIESQDETTASFKKLCKSGGEGFNETAARISIIGELTGEQMSKDSKTQDVLDKYNALPDTVQANRMLAKAKIIDAKTDLIINSANYSELSGDGEKLANAFQRHGCEVKQAPLHALGFSGKPAGYMIIFCICAVAYIIAWSIMKVLVPKYKPIVD